MTIRAWIIVGVLWLVSMAAVGSITYAQSPQAAPIPPNMITGTDLGFIVELQKGGIAFGQLMVRVDGQWRRAADIEATRDQALQGIVAPGGGGPTTGYILISAPGVSPLVVYSSRLLS